MLQSPPPHDAAHAAYEWRTWQMTCALGPPFCINSNLHTCILRSQARTGRRTLGWGAALPQPASCSDA